MTRVAIPFCPHDGHKAIFASRARTRVVSWGRRGGKTLGFVNLAIQDAVDSADGRRARGILRPELPGRCWVVAPSFKVANENWLMPGGLLPTLAIMQDRAGQRLADVSKTERRIDWHNGSITEVRTAENEDNVRGGGLTRLIFDEAGQIAEVIWMAASPAASDRLGDYLLGGTPKGKNWFYREWKRGQSETGEMVSTPGGTYQSWQFASTINPHFPASELERARASLPYDWFRQEYLAEFLESAAAVFRKLEERLVAGGAQAPKLGGRYIHGLDIAMKQDWTVLVTVDLETKRIVNMVRLQRIPYTEQAATLVPVIKQYPGTVWADATGVGTPVIENLRLKGVDINGFTFTADSKAQLVGNLMLAIETVGAIMIPTEGAEFKTLLSELRDYEYQTTPAGRVTWNAPSGSFDDCVMALGLAMWGIQHGGGIDNRAQYSLSQALANRGR